MLADSSLYSVSSCLASIQHANTTLQFKHLSAPCHCHQAHHQQRRLIDQFVELVVQYNRIDHIAVCLLYIDPIRYVFDDIKLVLSCLYHLIDLFIVFINILTSHNAENESAIYK